MHDPIIVLGDKPTLWAAVAAVTFNFLAAVGAYLRARYVAHMMKDIPTQIHNIHLDMNSKLDELLKLREDLAYLKGVAQGKLDEKARVSAESGKT